MLQAARYIQASLAETEALDRAVTMYPEYTVVITGERVIENDLLWLGVRGAVTVVITGEWRVMRAIPRVSW